MYLEFGATRGGEPGGTPKPGRRAPVSPPTPMLLIGEGTADIQRMIIGRRLLEDYAKK